MDNGGGRMMVKALTVIYAAASRCEAFTEDKPGLFTHADEFKCARGGLTPVCAHVRPRGWLGPPCSGRGNGIQAETKDANLDGKSTAG